MNAKLADDRSDHRSDADQRWVTFLTFAVGSCLLILTSSKIISIIIYLYFIISTFLFRQRSNRRGLVRLYIVSLVLMLSPVDLQFRRIGRFDVRFLPVVYNLGSSQKKRSLE